MANTGPLHISSFYRVSIEFHALSIRAGTPPPTPITIGTLCGEGHVSSNKDSAPTSTDPYSLSLF